MNLDSYDHNNSKLQFCRSCFHYIQKSNILKFGAINIINNYPYQDDSDIFQDFIRVEEVIIASAYPLILIFKLRPSGSSFLILY